MYFSYGFQPPSRMFTRAGVAGGRGDAPGSAGVPAVTRRQFRQAVCRGSPQAVPGYRAADVAQRTATGLAVPRHAAPPAPALAVSPFGVGVPKTLSRHATWAYSWIRPPSRSCRRTLILLPAADGSCDRAGSSEVHGRYTDGPALTAMLRLPCYVDASSRHSGDYAPCLPLERGSGGALSAQVEPLVRLR
jgi:hypothetical protein